METKTTHSIKKTVLPIALIFSVGRIMLDVIAKLTQASSKVYYATFLIAFVFEIIAIVYILKQYKKTQLDELDLKEALIIGVMFMIIVGGLFAIQSFFYDTYIDSEFQKKNALEWANLYGKGDDVKKMISESQGIQATSALFSIFSSILKFALLGILVSFIVGSLLRNK